MDKLSVYLGCISRLPNTRSSGSWVVSRAEGITGTMILLVNRHLVLELVITYGDIGCSKAAPGLSVAILKTLITITILLQRITLGLQLGSPPRLRSRSG